jgi:hypothetical protein
MNKICKRCKIDKDITAFYKLNKSKDGHQHVCKTCEKEYKDRNKEHCENYRKLYVIQNKEKISEYRKEYNKINENKIAEQKQKYYEENKDRISLYYDLNKEKIAIRRKDYYKENKPYFIASAAKRKAIKLQATPSWLTDEDFKNIQKFYEESYYLRLLTGEEYHVDHIVPLQGKTVCGLHVPWNLQILTAKENIAKSNKFDT